MSSRELPLFPLNTVLFPGGPLPLRVFEPRYVDMVGRCLKQASGFGVVLLIEGSESGGRVTATAALGTEAKIVDFDALENGLLGLTCIGLERIRVLRAWQQADGLNVGEVDDLAADQPTAVPADCAHLSEVLKRAWPQLADAYRHVAPKFDDAAFVANRLAELAPLEPALRQSLLEIEDPVERLRQLSPLVRIKSD
jgi:Lon protease-like protein